MLISACMVAAASTAEPTMRTARSALDHYVRRYAFVRRKIKRLQRLADDQFGHGCEVIHWRHIGDFCRVVAALDDALAIFDGQSG
jgi:hypothetical protein